MVEVQFAVPSIYADHLLPVVVEKRAFVVLNRLELVREAPSNSELVLAAGVV